MIETIYLHIGHHKTGTTAIQQFCTHNTSTLKELGYLIPETGLVEGGHHGLTSVWYRRKGIPDCAEDEIKRLLRELSNSSLKYAIVTSENFVWSDPTLLSAIT